MENGHALMEDIWTAFAELRLSNSQRELISAYLRLLKVKDIKTWEHSIRVGLLTRRIAGFMHLDGKALFYAGIFHDIGKIKTRLETLIKTKGWTADDTEEIKKHVVDGHHVISGNFPFTAEVILWHHRFQDDGYPKELPVSLLSLYVSEDTREKVVRFGRILAMADCFDALHRVNEKFSVKGALIGEQIQEKMLALNHDQQGLIERLYGAGIFK